MRHAATHRDLYRDKGGKLRCMTCDDQERDQYAVGGRGMNNTTKGHTQGPWIVRDTPESSNQDYVIESRINGRTVHIASIDYQLENFEAWTNARLIAAAPELLESLREMVADLISHATLGLNEKEVAMLKRAEAAITKAEGRGQ